MPVPSWNREHSDKRHLFCGSLTKCIKNVPITWLHISFLPTGKLLSLDTHFKRVVFTDKPTQNDPALMQTCFYIVFPTEKYNTSFILPEKSALFLKESGRQKIKDTCLRLFFFLVM